MERYPIAHDHMPKKVKLTDPGPSTQQDTPPQPKTSSVTYHCSVETCPQKGIAFTSKPVWYRHMTETHAPWPDGRFYCPFETCACHKSGFRYRVHYRQHMEWHVYHKDMLTKTTDDKPEEVARASQNSEMLIAAARSEEVAVPPPPRARFADLDVSEEMFLAQHEPCEDESADDRFWGEVRRRTDINWSGIGR